MLGSLLQMMLPPQTNHKSRRAPSKMEPAKPRSALPFHYSLFGFFADEYLPVPFFPGILPSRKLSETQGTRLVFGKNNGCVECLTEAILQQKERGKVPSIHVQSVQSSKALHVIQLAGFVPIQI